MDGRRGRSGDNLLPAGPDATDTTPSIPDPLDTSCKRSKADQGGQGKKNDARLSKKSPASSQAQDMDKLLFLAESVCDPVDSMLSKQFKSPTKILDTTCSSFGLVTDNDQ